MILDQDHAKFDRRSWWSSIIDRRSSNVWLKAADFRAICGLATNGWSLRNGTSASYYCMVRTGY
jgi:hypothetical protein